MSDDLDERLRTGLHRLVEGKSASTLMRQRIEHRLDQPRRTRAMVVVASVAAAALLIVAAVAVAGGSSSKPTHVASRGPTTAPGVSALAPPDVAPQPQFPDQAGRTPQGGPSPAPTTGVKPSSAQSSPRTGATPTPAPGSHVSDPPTTKATTPQPPRATPGVTDTSGPYAVEVVDRVNPSSVVGWFRRTDGKGSTIDGPDSYGAMSESDWGGTPGPRYLAMGSVGNASQGNEPGRIFVQGAVGVDAVRVDLVLPDGRQLPTTLGTTTVGQLRFWVVGYWPDTGHGYGKAVATDANGNTWQVDGGDVGFAFTH